MIFPALCAIIFGKAKTGYKGSFRCVLINDTARGFQTFLGAAIDVLEGFYIMVCIAKKGVFSMCSINSAKIDSRYDSNIL
jgi:hypothetical protein